MLPSQVLPFVLRREKAEVLADLPPKIITDILCDLTPAQRMLHRMWERGGEILRDGAEVNEYGSVIRIIMYHEEMQCLWARIDGWHVRLVGNR